MTRARLRLAVVAMSMLAAACGGGSHHASHTSSTSTSAGPAATTTRAHIRRRASHESRSGARAPRAAAADRPLATARLPDDRRPRKQPHHHRQPEQADRVAVPRAGRARRPGSSSSAPTTRSSPPGGRDIITNEEFSDTIAVVSLDAPSQDRLAVRPPGRTGQRTRLSRPPRRRLPAADGQIQVADIINCRVLWLNQRQARSCARSEAPATAHTTRRTRSRSRTAIRRSPTAACWSPRSAAGSTASRRTASCVWSIKTPTDYPSDAQLLPDGNVLVAGYNDPGRIDIITPHGTHRLDLRPVLGTGLARSAVARACSCRTG